MSRFVVAASWDDAPHLSEQAKKELWDSLPPYQRDARSKGIPQLGSGAIYPVPESDIVIPDMAIPEHWPRAYGLDVGWNKTAAIWGALNRDTGTWFLYSEHYQGFGEPPVHAAAIRARGEWIPGAIDPAANGRSQVDGRILMHEYRALGLDLQEAENAVEAGIHATWVLLSSGRLKVFASLVNWLSEYRIYRRDEAGRVVRKLNHLMDATRYLVMSGRDRAITKPVPNEPESSIVYQTPIAGGGRWMG